MRTEHQPGSLDNPGASPTQTTATRGTINLYQLEWHPYAKGCSVARHAVSDTWWSCITKDGHTSYDQLGAAMGMALMIVSSRYKELAK